MAQQQHIMKRFDEEMIKTKEKILSMGALVEHAVANAIHCVIEQDHELAKKTIEQDEAINALEVECDEMTRTIMVRRQPAASDLRFIIAIIKLVEDLERMGDLASNIAAISLELGKQPSAFYDSIESMGEKVLEQISRAMNALSTEDSNLALETVGKDKKIDKRLAAMQREALTYMMEDMRSISSMIKLSNIAKQLERIADHAVNIAEMVIYIVEGHDIRHVNHKEAKRLVEEYEKNKAR